MELLKNFFMRSPGGENEGGGSTSDNSKKEEAADGNAANQEEHPHEKGFIGKIKDALKDWAEKDQQDLDYDDTRV